jgi:thiol-disulfide isomerase/thioredoxin
MEFAIVTARVLLAFVFLVAGLAKLADLPGSRKSMADFGVPKGLAPVFGLLLPLGEIAIAIALLPSISAWWGGVGALALLLIFIAGIIYNLARGRTPDCHCFGKLHSAPIGWKTIARNAVFCAFAAAVVYRGTQQPPLLGWTEQFSGMQLAVIFGGSALFVSLAAILWLLVQMIKQNGRMLLRIEALEAKPGAQEPAQPAPAGLPVGSPAPEVALPDLAGNKVELQSFRGKPAALLFWNPHCGFCQGMLDRIKAWENNGARGVVNLLVVSAGSVEDNRAQGFRSPVVIDEGFATGNAFGASGTPSAVMVDREGRIASQVAVGAEEVLALIHR